MATDSWIKLGSIEDGPWIVHGYHRTSEGRDFLRELYPIYLRRQPKGDWKVASIIADEKTSDDKEVDKTRSALKRWSTGQKDLWGNDAGKTLRVLARLEHEMMTVEPVRQILEDQAASIHKRDVGNALAILFYGLQGSPIKSVEVEALFTEKTGLFRTYEDAWGTIQHDRNYLTYYGRPEGANFLLVHEFLVDKDQTSRPVFREHKSGYAIPVPDGSIYRFMIDETDPRRRIFQTLILHKVEIGEGRTLIYKIRGHKADIAVRPDHVEHERLFKSYDRDDNIFLANYMRRIIWNIIL